MAVPESELPCPFEPGDAEAVQRLTVIVGRPASRAFIHASAAEVVFRALCWADAEEWEGAAMSDIGLYLSTAEVSGLLPAVTQSRMAA